MTEPQPPVGVFISHTHADKEIALALDRALVRLFGRENLVVSYSSKKHEAGGVRAGENWFQWIVDRVRGTQVALVLLTPASIHKPWLLWEAGAVQGLALGDDAGSTVIPLSFALSDADVPTPFAQTQVAKGDNPAEIRLVFQQLIREHLPGPMLLEAGEILREVIDEYVAKVALALRDAPLLPTEPVVQEWCLRLDDLRASGRKSEVGHVHDWLNVAFGRERGETERPLDFRIHRRLGDLYMSAGDAARAVTQYDLARSVAPRDLLILRQLGRAQLDNEQVEAAGETIAQIRRLDAAAFVHNVECAALLGRWHRERHELHEERDVYREALANAPDSYYLADLLGQTQLSLRDVEAARVAYRKASAALERVSDHNIWTHATAATAAIVNGDEQDGLAHLRCVRRDFNPGNDDLASIGRGLGRLRDALPADAETFERWMAALMTREPAH